MPLGSDADAVEGEATMYLDHILLAAGSVMLLTTLLLGALLFRSRKSSREYRRILRDETERVDVISTLRNTQSVITERLTGEVPVRQTDPLPDGGSPQTTELNQTTLPTEPLTGRSTLPEMEQTAGVGKKLDLSLLEGRYQLLKELHGGGMSRIFLARHRSLGNEWIVKFVDNRNAELANEAEVLKKLNHISLPQIIDIFRGAQGTFLVERYIEGYTLEQTLQFQLDIKEGQICDWGLQLAQVLRYLHNLDTPIIHCDLKPSNMMVTHDNRLVLIDFGISKRQGITEKAIGMTYRYAAPEQFQGRLAASEAAIQRFGALPDACCTWQIDARTDIYSAGVILFELVTGQAPNWKNEKILDKMSTSGLAQVIHKCLEVDPDRRYQSAQELESALKKLSVNRLNMARSLVKRRVAMACCLLLFAGGLGTTASGAYINQMETQAVVVMDPGEAVVTEQQGVQLLIQKSTANGSTVTLEPSQIQWSYSDDNIARLDGDRLVGLNVGETTLHGRYRNKDISLHVTVTEPIGELVGISLQYPEETEVSVYAGNGERDFIDGGLDRCSFVSPELLSAGDGKLCISDSGVIRILENGVVSTTNLEPAYLTADQDRSWRGDLYVRTGPWEAEDGSYYGILRVSGGEAELLFRTEAAWSVIRDFALSSNGTLWFLWENLGTGITALYTLDANTLEPTWVMDLPDGAAAMAFDGADNLYFAVPDLGVILRSGKGEASWTYFAGVEGERNFIDGAVPNFYRPTSLAVDGNALYVLDFDTVRRVTISGAGTSWTETLAGVPVADTNPEVVLGAGCQCVLPASELAGLAVDGEGRLLVSDPKNSVIYEILK